MRWHKADSNDFANYFLVKKKQKKHRPVLGEYCASFRWTRSKGDLKAVSHHSPCVWVSLSSLCVLPSQDNYGSQCVSQPPTPSPLSPSPASLSSYQGDDSDSISSPAWPKNPSSPVSASCTFTLFSLFSCFSFFFLWLFRSPV